MPWSDEERLDRVYRRAHAIKASRRMRVVAMAMPLLLLAGAVVAAAGGGDGDGDGRQLVQATATTTTAGLELPVPTTETTVTLPTVPPPPTVTVPRRPPTTLPITTTTTRPPDAKNCGAFVRGDYQAPPPPEGMTVTIEASKQTVRRGQDVLLTVRARWSGSEPFTHKGSRNWQLVFAHLDGPIFYSSQYDEAYKRSDNGEETFQPGEEKQYSFVWKTTQSCGPNGVQDAWLKSGTYTVEGHWNDFAGTGWEAEPIQVKLVD